MATETNKLVNGSDTVNKVNHKNEEKEDMDKINSIKSEKDNETVVTYSRRDSPVERVKFEGFDDKDSICSEDSSSLDDGKLPPIPDGGWGWVVVLAGFLVSACADGLAFSFGLLHEEFTNYFKESQSKTALIGSIFMATPLLAGPIMSALVDRFGCRTTTMIAGLVSTISFLLAAISNSIEMLCLTFGFLSGLAMGILYVTAVVSVAFWFDKRRNFAVSLASCGIGFGTLLYSPLTSYLLNEYGWRSTVIFLAGTLLNMCVCGALMRNPEYLDIKQKRERALSRKSSRRSSSVASLSSRSIGGESVFLTAEELKILLKSGKSPDYILATLATTIAEAEEIEANTQMNADLASKRVYSALHLPTFVQRNEKVPTEVLENLMENKRLYNIILQNYPEIITRRKSEVQLTIEPPPADVAIEPVKLPVAIKVKNIDVQELAEIQKDRESIDAKTDQTDVVKNENNKSKNNIKENAVFRERKDSRANRKDSIKKDEHYKSKNSIKESDVSKNRKESIKNEPKENISRKNSKTQKNELLSSKEHMKAQNKESKPGHASQPGWMHQISVDRHYFRDMPLYKNTMMHRGAMMNIPRYKLRASSLPDMYRNSDWSLASSIEMTFYDRAIEVVKSTFDFRMFTEFHFMMFNVSTLILSVWFIAPYFFLTSFMSDRGTDGGETMISIIGIASSIGIVGLGWMGDLPWVNVMKTYALCLIICGLSVAAYPFFIEQYWALTVISSIFGLSFASSYSYLPAILMELMPMDHFTVAYGLILLVEGIGHLAGPPIGGLFYDLTGSWDLTFYVGGAWIIVSGFFVAVIAFTKDVRLCGTAPLLKDLERESEKEKSEES